MITVDVLAFLAVIAIAILGGARIAIYVYGVNADQNQLIARFRADNDVDDAADMAETTDHA